MSLPQILEQVNASLGIIIKEMKENNKQLTRIAECQKLELWFKMENDATERQKGAMSGVLTKL